MGDMAVPVALQAVNIGSNHYHKVREPLQYQYRKARGLVPREDPDVRDNRNWDEKGYVLRKRSEVGPDEEIVETVRHRGEVLPRRPRPARATSSMDNMRDNDKQRSRGSTRGGSGGNRSSSYDSEGSVAPRGRVRPRSENGRRRRNNSSSSSSSDTSLGSSTDDERKCKKMARKKWITAALASVATIHAASKVYGSIENHDKRIIAVEKGEMSPEEAHKKQTAARWQDAAAIGLAALGIKGAISEWHEVQEEHGEHKEMLKKKEEHHKKRLERERRLKAQKHGGYYKGRDGNWYYDGPTPQSSESQQARSDVRSRSRAGGSRALDGPRHGDQLLLEGGRERSRSDQDYNGGRGKSRARSEYGRDRGYSPDDRDRRRSRSRRARDRYDDYDYDYDNRNRTRDHS